MAARSKTKGTRSAGRSAAWRVLEDHHARMQGVHLRKLFADDPKRAGSLRRHPLAVLLDYSKNRIDDETLRLLLGKVLAQRIIPELESKVEPTLGHDSPTNNLILWYRRFKGAS